MLPYVILIVEQTPGQVFNMLYSDSMMHMSVFLLLSAMFETVFTRDTRQEFLSEYKIKRMERIEPEITHNRMKSGIPADNVGKTPIQILIFFMIVLIGNSHKPRRLVSITELYVALNSLKKA